VVARRVVLAIECCAIAREREAAIGFVAVPPALVGAANVVARVAPADPAVHEVLDERENPLCCEFAVSV
jgi:hypothetical protein